MIYFISHLVCMISGAIGLWAFQRKYEKKPVTNEKAQAIVTKSTEEFKRGMNEKLNQDVNVDLDAMGGSPE